MEIIGPPGRRGPDREPPIGIVVAHVAKIMARAFDDALAAAGGTRSTWLVLLAIKSGAARTQGELAERVGIRSPTLTHHLDRLERDGLVVRARGLENRRVQQVALTPAGDAVFFRLRDSAVAFDRRARAGLSVAETAELRRLLALLRQNIEPRGAEPVPGLPFPAPKATRPTEV